MYTRIYINMYTYKIKFVRQKNIFRKPENDGNRYRWYNNAHISKQIRRLLISIDKQKYSHGASE